MCNVPKGPLTILMCIGKENVKLNDFNLNNSQCEVDFHAQANSQTKCKNLTCFQQIIFFIALAKYKGHCLYNVNKYRGQGPFSRPHIVHMKYKELCDVLGPLSKKFSRALNSNQLWS